ncbi:MAG: hypothetical protein U0794_05585 [Isosphaeraceae bacterium]
MANAAVSNSTSPGDSLGGTVTSDPDAASPRALIERFEDRLQTLSAQVDEATQQMESALDALRSGGHLPSHKLILSLGEAQRQLTRLRHDLLLAAAQHGLKIRPSWRLAGVRELDEFLASFRDLIHRTSTEPPASPATHTASPAPDVPSSPVYLPPAEPVANLDQPVAETTHTADTSPVPAEPESDHVEEMPVAATPHVVVSDLTDQPIPSEENALSEGEILGPDSELTPDKGVEQEALPETQPTAEEAPSPPTPTSAPRFDPTALSTALGTLERASRLSLRDGSALAELTAYHEQAESLRRSIQAEEGEGLDEVLMQLASGVHPIAQLINAVDGSDDLNDAQWADLHSTVTQQFGRPLAVALARHRLVVSPRVEA